MSAIPASHFEAKKHAYRQTQDGIVVSFVVHPNDVTPSLAMAALGTRFMVALAEIGDDEKPASANGRPSDFDSENSGSNPEAGASTEHGRPRAEDTPCSDKRADAHGSPARKLSEQCALRCKDKRFWEWIRKAGFECWNDEDAANWVRNDLVISSRSLIDSDPNAAKNWRSLEKAYQQWLTDQMHAGSYR